MFTDYWVSVSIYLHIKTLSLNAVGLTWDAHTPLCKTKTKHDLKRGGKISYGFDNCMYNLILAVNEWMLYH